jgi:photosystem II stability/assembly factor-like uncharacterized protein
MLSLILCLLQALCMMQSSSSPTAQISSASHTQEQLEPTRNDLFQRSITVFNQNHDIQLTNIRVLDKDNIWAVGREKRKDHVEQSVLLHTTDGGVTWERRLADSERWFYAVHFINTEVGWIAGYNGLILKTIDGGMTWSKQGAPTHSSLVGIQFINPDWGWIIGDDGELLHTSDGGKNWRSYKLKGHGWFRSNSSADRFGGWLCSFQFTDKFHGWILGEGGKVYQSTDGGVSWDSRGDEIIRLVKKQNRNHQSQVEFKKIHFINPRTGFIAANIRTGRQDEWIYSGMLLKTEDSGRTWQPFMVSEHTGLAGAHVINANEMWVIPVWGNNLFYSQDGGRNWISIPGPPEDGDILQIYFIDSKNGWLLVSYGSFYDRIIYTQDGGRTWTHPSD